MKILPPQHFVNETLSCKIAIRCRSAFFEAIWLQSVILQLPALTLFGMCFPHTFLWLGLEHGHKHGSGWEICHGIRSLNNTRENRLASRPALNSTSSGLTESSNLGFHYWSFSCYLSLLFPLFPSAFLLQGYLFFPLLLFWFFFSFFSKPASCFLLFFFSSSWLTNYFHFKPAFPTKSKGTLCEHMFLLGFCSLPLCSRTSLVLQSCLLRNAGHIPPSQGDVAMTSQPGRNFH